MGDYGRAWIGLWQTSPPPPEPRRRSISWHLCEWLPDRSTAGRLPAVSRTDARRTFTEWNARSAGGGREARSGTRAGAAPAGLQAAPRAAPSLFAATLAQDPRAALAGVAAVALRALAGARPVSAPRERARFPTGRPLVTEAPLATRPLARSPGTGGTSRCAARAGATVGLPRPRGRRRGRRRGPSRPRKPGDE